METLSLGLRKFYQRHLFFPSEKRIRDLVISFLKGTEILDAGCGNGWLSACAWEEGFNVHSFDVSESEVRESLFFFKKRNVNIGLAKASMLNLPLVESCFDSILCINVLEHVRKIEQAILEMKRVLRRKGRLILIVPNGLTFGLFYDRFVSNLVSIRTALSQLYRVTFSMSDDDISLLKLNKKERIGHHQQFTLKGICNVLTRHGFSIVEIRSCRFLSPYLRSFCSLMRREPVMAFENLDNKIANRVPRNLAADWVIVCEKTLN